MLAEVVGYLWLAVEAIGAAIVGFGALATAFRYILSLLGVRSYTNNETRLYLGRYLALGLEFQLGADILGTAVSPGFEEIGKLGAIATIRTALNYFLARELREEAARAGQEEQRAAEPARTGSRPWA